ncbi:hypothetical protein CG405_08025, partial [Gardnerella vaginalis]
MRERYFLFGVVGGLANST